ncbi:DUF3991 and toprim domain-containing protein [Mesorhizobium xinjiangense]|uniref:DUF3991 and toprim domain-containing protein n=1 Tax=Mesorhizobium xinjiangense TaxID=2678685 RepID=UPI0012ED86D8|nr:DUF3991 and toprim domain-containing protein [Mesorhizobium xinjiangense]
MERNEVDELRDRVPCAAVLELAGFGIDEKESTRRAVKHRRGDDIIIVIHEGKGWFDPLSDAKGDVFSLIQHIDNVNFGEALGLAAELVGYIPREPTWRRPARDPDLEPSVHARWRGRRKPWRGSATWRYLRGERFLPETVLRAAIAADCLREGPHGSMWAAHVDASGSLVGWEERGPEWRGFSSGGTKILFRFGSTAAVRVCITEAAIDAMSLAAFEGIREGSLYLSTGGGWSPATEAAVRALANRPDVQLVAATDDNPQGEIFAGRLREIAETAGCDWIRHKPPAEDWNEAWKARVREEQARREWRRGLPHARRSRQG